MTMKLISDSYFWRKLATYGQKNLNNNSMNKYICKFQRDVEKLLADDVENPEKNNHIKESFNDEIGSLDIVTNGYALSDARDSLNKK